MDSLLYGDVSVMFPVRDWNQNSFHLHYLLAVEIPNCTTPYYTPRKLCLWAGILFSRCPSIRPSVRPSVCNVLFS